MSFALYELAQKKNVREKLRSEIRDTLKKHNKELPYEAVKDMEYLDKVFQASKTLRKYPSATNLIRVAVKNSTLPDSTGQIPIGTRVLIPVRGLHNDPRYFPEPEVFDPERFSEDAINQRPQMVYLPFGEDPRICIGVRFANHLIKLVIIRVIKNYEITLSPGMKLPFDIEKRTHALSPVGGIHIMFKKMV